GEAGAAFQCPLVVKVKEIQECEFAFLKAGTCIFAYHQLAATAPLLRAVLARGVTCIGYETVEDARGELCLLSPMSRIAGCLAPQIAAWILAKGTFSGRAETLEGAGILLSSVSGLPAAKVVILGAGQVGGEAARIASALGCEVVVFARTPRRFDALRAQGRSSIRTALLSETTLAAELVDATVLIGAVLERGRLSPRVVTRAMLRSMREGAAFVDVGIDQGGIAETSRPTSHDQPLYREEGVLHYCVPNIPALVSRTATLALTTATLPYIAAIADRGLYGAAAADPGLALGIQVHDHVVVDARLAAETGHDSVVPPWRD
ncbi:MAG: NAD(P)-dependent oxidoreductase, partial [Burkholderiaceae bacterium]